MALKTTQLKIAKAQLAAHYNRTPRRRFTKAKHYAKRYGHKWKIIFTDYKNIIAGPCNYCGSFISNETGCGLDRVNSSLGYLIGNVVACCGICNQMKCALPLNLFKDKIIQIYKIFQKKGGWFHL